MSWDIKPFVGMGPVLFGMTEAEVAALRPSIGTLTARDPQYDGTITEHRGLETPSISYFNGKVCYIAAGFQVKGVTWQALDVFQAKPEVLLQALETANGGAEVVFGTIAFRKLGLDAIGFYLEKNRRFFKPKSRDQDDRCVSLYDRDALGRVSEQVGPHYQPISFLKK